LQDINDLYPVESPRPGSTVFIPSGRVPKAAGAIAKERKPTAVVPAHAFGYADRRQVFYEPVFGDRLEDIARVAKVTPSEVRRWNHLDPRAKLQHGMLLQLHVPKDHRPGDTLFYELDDVEVLTVESPRFFEHVVGGRGRARIEIVCSEGDTWKSIGRKYGVSLGTLERINHRSRRSRLKPGQRVVVYAERDRLESLRSDVDREEKAAQHGDPASEGGTNAQTDPTTSSTTRQAPSGPAS
ncbi:MAG: LysM peptidoglycan-binding domain-containing protein, partial [Polyangiaceae bacterium]